MCVCVCVLPLCVCVNVCFYSCVLISIFTDLCDTSTHTHIQENEGVCTQKSSCFPFHKYTNTSTVSYPQKIFMGTQKWKSAAGPVLINTQRACAVSPGQAHSWANNSIGGGCIPPRQEHLLQFIFLSSFGILSSALWTHIRATGVSISAHPHIWMRCSCDLLMYFLYFFTSIL